MRTPVKEQRRLGELRLRHATRRTNFRAKPEPELRVRRICDSILDRLNKIPTRQIAVRKGPHSRRELD